jgi:hypothetical protein
MIRVATPVCVGLLLGACAESPAPPPAVSVAPAPVVPDTGSILVRCGRLIDGLSDTVQNRASVLIVEGRIAAVGEGLQAPPGTPALDLQDHTCLPGLIDLHVHITDRPEDTADLSVFYGRTPEEQTVR